MRKEKAPGKTIPASLAPCYHLPRHRQGLFLLMAARHLSISGVGPYPRRCHEHLRGTTDNRSLYERYRLTRPSLYVLLRSIIRTGGDAQSTPKITPYTPTVKHHFTKSPLSKEKKDRTRSPKAPTRSHSTRVRRSVSKPNPNSSRPARQGNHPAYRDRQIDFQRPSPHRNPISRTRRHNDAALSSTQKTRSKPNHTPKRESDREADNLEDQSDDQANPPPLRLTDN